MISSTVRTRIWILLLIGLFSLPNSFVRADAQGSTMILAAYQAWHGLDNHTPPPNFPYDSTDPIIISRQIQAAKAQNIHGFIVDWYGPKAGVANDKDREFIDRATAELFRQAEIQDFYIAIMYDEGTVSASETEPSAYTSRVNSDLDYVKQYFTSPAYLSINEHPALFVFPYPSVDQYVDWSDVRNTFGIPITLLDKDPNPNDLEHDNKFDGFYAWVQPANGQWMSDGSEWGEEYLKWFYSTMNKAPYTDRITVGGVWPGFNDSLAQWGQNRYISHRCGQTWKDTWKIAHKYNVSIVMIDTWNDFEEGTDIEFGIELIPYPTDNSGCVDTNTAITATFFDPMASSTITSSTFFVSDGSSNTKGTIAYADKTATFAPATDFDYDTTYTVTITTGAKDVAGNALENDYTWSFTTARSTDGGGDGDGDGSCFIGTAVNGFGW